MSKKIRILRNYMFITDTDSGKTEVWSPAHTLRYEVDTLGNVTFFKSDKNDPIGIVKGYNFTNAVDLNDLAFVDEPTFHDWLNSNTGFKTASGGSGAEVGATQQVGTFASLIAGDTIGDLAYVENSQGSKWLPGTYGGTYYPSGWYLWSGSAWESDKNAIAKALNNQNKAIKIVTNNYLITDADFTILADGSANTVTSTLPPTPIHGDIYNVKAIDTTFACDVSGNGLNIDGSPSNVALLLTDSLTFQYDSTYGWAII